MLLRRLPVFAAEVAVNGFPAKVKVAEISPVQDIMLEAPALSSGGSSNSNSGEPRAGYPGPTALHLAWPYIQPCWTLATPGPPQATAPTASAAQGPPPL